ncbi:hypothetical protein PoB_003698400 [Plakobranchus ocellatus]|uniref:Uncharacterized protein n=1 Tax=Plakobranchus ocellatus TaxID=259542 RepID=A0AAV4AVS9_9GAST|nr:hypothetical protein PoB_003698400 [Plakobranchus ocellatus]
MVRKWILFFAVNFGGDTNVTKVRQNLLTNLGDIIENGLIGSNARKTSLSDINPTTQKNVSAPGAFVYQFHACLFSWTLDCRKTQGYGDVNLVSGKNFQALCEATAKITQYL